MAKYIKDAATGVVTTTDDGFLDDVTAGLKAVTLAEGELLDGKSVRYALGLYGLATVIGTSIITRRRAASGAKPMAKVFF